MKKAPTDCEIVRYHFHTRESVVAIRAMRIFGLSRIFTRL